MLSYEIHGTGPRRIIAAHSWLSDRQTFHPLLEHLSPEEFSIVLVDARGFGDSARITGEYSIAEWASDTLEVADRLGWDRFAIIGHSMGGKLAQYLLTHTPHRLDAAIGVAPIPAGRIPLDDDSRAFLTSAIESTDARRGIFASGTGRPASAHWLNTVTQHSATRTTPAAFAGFLNAWADEEFVYPTTATVPTLIIAGSEDTSASPDTLRATWLASQSSAQFETLAGVGHYPLDEAPLATSGLIESFLTTHP